MNLFWAINRMNAVAADKGLETSELLKTKLLDEAHAIAEEDVRINKQIGMNALPLVPDQATIIHHCNTGSLATVDYGTAFGVIRTAHEQGKKVNVLVDETRPRLQGGRCGGLGAGWSFRKTRARLSGRHRIAGSCQQASIAHQ